MKVNNAIVTIVLLMCCCINSYTQTDKSQSNIDKLLRQATLQYELSNYKQAIELYKTILKIQPNSFETNYDLGMLYFYELNQKRESISYFLTAIDNMKDTVPDIFNYAGQALMSEGEYDKAIELFQIYSAIPARPGFLKVVMRPYITKCNNDKAYAEEIRLERKKMTQEGIQIFNAGHIINTNESEIAPRPFNENNFIFTSSRDFDYQFNKNVDKPFFAYMKNGEISYYDRLDKTEHVKMIYDTDWNLIISDFMPDLSKVASIYEDNIYYSAMKINKEYNSYKLPANVNFTKISSVALSTGGLRMVFSAQDKKTKRWDLYFTTYQTDGNWRNPEKIDILSSEQDEQYPFFSADGFTLFFSSTGFDSMGGYDIFKSTLKDDNTWSAPERLPEPINSPENDIWFSITPDGKKGYFSSDRPGGFGGYDIYEIYF